MCVITLISASRPALCLLTTLLSAAFTLALFVHIPYKKDDQDKYSVPEDQPMFVLPSVFIFVHIAAVIIIVSTRATRDAGPDENAPPPAAVAWPPVADSVLSSLWARVAVAAARLEAQSSAATAHSTFAHHALFTGNSFIVLCTIALAAPHSGAEETALVDLRPPLEIYLDSCMTTLNDGNPCSISSSASDADPPFSVATPKPEVDDGLCHVDLATEAFDRAVEGGWPWLLRFAWRRRSFAPRPSHVVPHSFEWLLWRSGSVTFTKTLQSFGWAAIAAIVVTRTVLFVAPFLEPAFNTNPPTAVYVCLAVRVACWVGIGLLAPGLYRAVCCMASFAVASGGPTGRAPATMDAVRGAVVRAGRCIAAAYDLSAPMALAFSVPHCVVSRVVISRAVAPFLPPDALA